MSIKVNVSVGIGAWTARKKVHLVACPHVGDHIVVGEQVVVCDRVTIGSKDVDVHQTVHFTSEDQATDYFAAEVP